ncbi:hypothetical protein CHLNCDRAFT_54534 [Chlorella variabilis]|uniref:Methyltransferase FkbM domain-containing protein n=1 Tax=Chlorella variabilis TaxID=554065 RepID=E1ZPA3_CHLVA|nr:hypothetical protein CHLNCDRAFT_54534 [Chlorella variabilis]EFN52217.1 hypothetical protein CHLNCDRAFT_54534 [Chlorella variabilis]|eukprot:XP_005844319.1 hypothetical protein CHLNCDRAFT_54534 [Chlorella variabilis]
MVALAALDGTACLLMLSLGRHAVGMLAPLAVQMDALTQYPPAAGRKLLMDFGAGQGYEGQELRSSLSYLLAHYEQMGVHFDEVWAWEPRPVNQSTYWQGVPPDVKFRLHLYNTGLEGDTTSPAHPIQYIKQNVQAGDFLVIKLDVDTQSVEIPFMRAVQADADLRSRIGEILFEMHYIHQDMPWFIGYGDGISYNDALNLFHSLRHEGLRIHYWP